MALMGLSAFKEISTQDLITTARSLPGGCKIHIPNRITAIVLWLGARLEDLN